MFISGIVVRDFRGFPSIQEVECWGGTLEADVKLLSLKLFEAASDSVVAYVNPLTSECLTFREFSSCLIDAIDTRKTKLRVLVSDLEEGHSREYGCVATRLKALDTHKVTWKIAVQRRSMFDCFHWINFIPSSFYSKFLYLKLHK